MLLETLFGLARDGKVGRSRQPVAAPARGDLLRVRRARPSAAATARPSSEPLFAPFAALGRVRGYRARYPAYSEGVSDASGEYVFIDEWHVDAPPEAVFDALADAAT